MADSKKTNIEKIGFWLTLVCAVHCMATPILITFLPYFGSKFEILHRYENVFLTLSFVLAIYLLGRDYRSHKNIVPMQLIVLAAIIKLLDLLFLNKSFEIYVSISIAGAILFAYWLNWKHKERCRCHTIQ